MPIKGSKGGLTQRKNLEQVAKATKKRPSQLDQRVPEPLKHLWKWYDKELKWSSPLSYLELEAWSRLTRREVTAVEVDVLMNLDKHYRNTLCQTT